MAVHDHILVVDDEAEIRNLLSEYLQKNGYRVTAVADGEGMRAAIENRHPGTVAGVAQRVRGVARLF